MLTDDFKICFATKASILKFMLISDKYLNLSSFGVQIKRVVNGLFRTSNLGLCLTSHQ